jgi:hypothetical protein
MEYSKQANANHEADGEFLYRLIVENRADELSTNYGR